MSDNNFKANLIRLGLFAAVLGLAVWVGFSLYENVLVDLGADTPFGRIAPTALADLKGDREISYRVGNLGNKDFTRLAKLPEIESRNLSLSKKSVIAESLGFSDSPKEVEDPNGEQKSVWQTKERILETDSDRGTVTYTDFEPIGGKIVGSESDARQIATDFLTKSDLLADLKVTKTNLVKIGKGVFVQGSNEANSFEVIFAQNLDSYKIVTPNLDGNASLVIGFDRKVKSLIYLAPTEFSKVGHYPTKGKDQAIKALVSGQAALSDINLNGQGYLMGESYAIREIVVSSLSLVYIDDGRNNYLQPHYQFTGEARLANGKKATVTLLVNAIKNKYLKAD